MGERRRVPRFAVSGPAEARLHVLQDVIIESSGPGGLTVLAASSSSAGEELAVRIRAGDGQATTLRVRTLESRPVVLGTMGLRHRLTLEVIATDSGRAPAGEAL